MTTSPKETERQELGTTGHLQLLQRITEQMTVHRKLGEVLGAITRGLVDNADASLARIWLYTNDRSCAACQRDGLKEASPDGAPALHLCASAGLFDGVGGPHHRLAIGMFLGGRVAERREPELLNDLSHHPHVQGVPWIGENGIVSYAGYPLMFASVLEGVLGIFRRRPFTADEFRVLGIFASQAAIAIKTASLIEEVEKRSERLSLENEYLQEEIEQGHGGEIVGASRAFGEVLAKVERVAPTDTTVLLLGETGTGKELVARFLHAHSQRRGRPLIRVNCGAISSGLVESELFGHERGAFSGALQRRLGRFELADGGTLLLDEVGELPADVQVKLLRVLQDGVFERVGGEKSIRADVRVVAATNRDLEADVASGRFRADLFYRLSVFPVRVPALRERMEDIPLLVRHFLAAYERKFNKPLRAITAASLARLQEYRWPGNIRELQNVLERSCVLAQGDEVEVVSLAGTADAILPKEQSSLDEVDREHIQRVLRSTQGIIQGPRGAARILGLHPNTLRSRMERLGVLVRRRLPGSF
jgi:formate hydrogenlyase transcriptional activator